MSASLVKKKNHYAPIGLLKAWADERGKICHTYSRSGMYQTAAARMDSVGYEKYIHVIRPKYANHPAIRLFLEYLCSKHGVKSVSPDIESTLLQEIDTRGVIAIDQLRSHGLGGFSQDALQDMMRFLYILQARNPAILREMHETGIVALRDLAKHLPETLADGLHVLSEDLNAGKLLLIDNLLDANLGRKLYDGISGFEIFLDPAAPQAFITTSYPYVSLPDIGNSGALHVLPLSPTRCLIMTRDQQLLALLRAAGPEGIAKLVNFMMAVTATQIFSAGKKEAEDVVKYVGLFHQDRKRTRELFRQKLREALAFAPT